MSDILAALAAASLPLTAISGGVLWIAVAGRRDDGHSVADYRPDPADTITAAPDPAPVRRTLAPGALDALHHATDELRVVDPWAAPLAAPLDPRDLEGAPIWEALMARQWLRELADRQRTGVAA